mmetsp:Transcript_26922/g.47669  ORF Transcript_26922/g.47669 Transcript_26922/m.47669 type:complete len:277 (-) Transcript_26922:199-1029(-)
MLGGGAMNHQLMMQQLLAATQGLGGLGSTMPQVPGMSSGMGSAGSSNADSGYDSGSRKRKATGPPDACWFFMRGLCSKGEWCKFSHDPDTIALAQVSEDTSGEFPAWKTEMCRFFTKKGTCRFGQYCLYAHSPMELRSRGMPVQPVPAQPQLPAVAQVAAQGGSFLDRLEAGLGSIGGGAAHPGYGQGAPSTAAALLGSGYGGGAAAAAASQPTPAQASLDEAMKQIQALQQQQVAAAALSAAPQAAQDPGAAYQLQLQQYLASMQAAMAGGLPQQ